MFVYKIIDVYFICVDVSARACVWLIYENLDLKMINILLKRLFHKRSFSEIIFKKKVCNKMLRDCIIHTHELILG